MNRIILPKVNKTTPSRDANATCVILFVIVIQSLKYFLMLSSLSCIDAQAPHPHIMGKFVRKKNPNNKY